jgi:hypothetical protein
MFDGQDATSSTISLTITENGATIATEIDTAYYLESPYQPLGMSISANDRQFDFLYISTDPRASCARSGPRRRNIFRSITTRSASRTTRCI